MSSRQWAGAAVRTESGKPASRQAVRSSSDSSHQASWAPWPAWAMALPADISTSGLIHRTGCVGSAPAGGSGSSRSVPETWRRARSLGQPSSGTGGKTRTSADLPVTVMPGSASALRHSAPRARRTTLRMRASCQSCIARAHSPSPVERSSPRITRTARAAVSRASVRAGGAARSMRATRGSTNCGASSRAVLACRKGLSGASEVLTGPVCQAARRCPAGAPGGSSVRPCARMARMERDLVVRLSGVGRRYGLRGPWVLRGVDLGVGAGALVRWRAPTAVGSQRC